MLNYFSKESPVWMNTLLIMQYFSFFENLVNFRKNLYHHYKASNSLLDRYNIFHLCELSKVNLQNNYVEKIKKHNKFSDEKESNDIKPGTSSDSGPSIIEDAKQLKDIYSSAYDLNTMKTQHSYFLDVNKPLLGDILFNEIIDMITCVVKKQLELCNYLQNNKNVITNNVYEFNKS